MLMFILERKRQNQYILLYVKKLNWNGNLWEGLILLDLYELLVKI